MSIALAEKLKREWTDKYVVVQEGIPELRRFVGLTGQVRTVNMNGRALVQFDHPVDISWYDIDPSFLKIVPAPEPKKAAEVTAAKPAAAPAPKSAAAPAADGTKKLSPLELARMQGAAGSAKKLSPLELARQQGAAKPKPATETPPSPSESSGGDAPAGDAPKATGETPAEERPVESKPAAGKPLSVAEMIALARKQGAPKNG